MQKTSLHLQANNNQPCWHLIQKTDRQNMKRQNKQSRPYHTLKLDCHHVDPVSHFHYLKNTSVKKWWVSQVVPFVRTSLRFTSVPTFTGFTILASLVILWILQSLLIYLLVNPQSLSRLLFAKMYVRSLSLCHTLHLVSGETCHLIETGMSIIWMMANH